MSINAVYGVVPLHLAGAGSLDGSDAKRSPAPCRGQRFPSGTTARNFTEKPMPGSLP